MLADVARRFRMLSRAERVHWAAMAPVGLAAAALDAAAGALVFALLTVLVDQGAAAHAPLVDIIRARLAPPGRDPLVAFALATAVVHISKTALLIVLTWWRTRVMALDTAALSTRVLGAYMAAPWTFHLRRGSAELIETVRESTRPFFGVFEAASIVLTESAVIVGLGGVTAAVAPTGVTLAAWLLLIGVGLTLHFTRATLRRGGARQFDLGAALYRHVQHSLGALKELRMLGRSQAFVEDFARDAREIAGLDTLRGTLEAVPRLVLETLFIVGLLALVLFYGRENQGAVLPLLSLYAYAGYRLVPAAHRIAQQINTVRWSLAASERLTQDLADLERFSDRDHSGRRLDLRHRLDLVALSFAYEGSTTLVLRDVNLSIVRGESIALVGATGAGKTTLVDIIAGLLAPTAGSVVIDGSPLGDRQTEWQASIGYVPQAPFLIDDTVRRNIALGIRDAAVDEKALARAMSMARLDDVVNGLAQGVATVVGERGIRLSGGERQRIAIARALYRDPALVIFDEATSSLDPGTEREVAEAVERLKGACTVIVIAHRMSTVERCDRVLLLSDGEIAASGAYGELAAGNESFRRLAALS